MWLVVSAITWWIRATVWLSAGSWSKGALSTCKQLSFSASSLIILQEACPINYTALTSTPSICDPPPIPAGGKLLDMAKMVAHGLGLPMVMVPSLASTDAPCLAVSIVYSDAGE
jgi:hypothetical protein